jgi:hypothetical protein
MNMNYDLHEELQAIHAKLDTLLAAVNELRDAKRAKSEARKVRKVKLPPLTEEEMKDLQGRFGKLFDQWMQGQEMEVQTELEKWDVDQLRRFADANNLNVTSKMSAQKVLQLIGARFREKRQLLGGMPRKSGSST